MVAINVSCFHRNVAQLVEYLLWEQRVVGSNPAIPTLYDIDRMWASLVCRYFWKVEITGSNPVFLINLRFEFRP